MNLPDWQNLRLADGVLREPGSREIILWLPGASDGSHRLWQRIGTVPGARIATEDGLCSIAATSVPARQQMQGWLTWLWHRWRGPVDEQVWILPNGHSATQCGARQTDLLLVWPEDTGQSLDDEELRRPWPDRPWQRLGANLFIVVPLSNTAAKAGPEPPSARQQAEDLVNRARRRGNRRQEVVALTDLGVALLRDSAAPQAIQVLQAAWQLARQLGDGSLEADVIANLGDAFLHDAQPGCALKLLEQALARARAAADRFQELSVLAHLGAAHSHQGDPAGAILCYEQALLLANQLGDRRQQADLHWHLAIQKADIGLRDEANGWAQAAVDLFEALGDPKARWLAHNLKEFQENSTPTSLQPAPDVPISSGMYVGGWAESMATPHADARTTGPGLLRMAMSATKSMAKFLGSGLKTVDLDIQRNRLKTCTLCEHHTGMRCRICGCFTTAKAVMAHERCPLGKWPN